MERVVTDEVKKTTVKNVLIGMETRYNYVLENDNGPLLAATDFKIVDFWSNLGTASTRLSDEVTKLSLIYSNDPLPSEAEVLGLLTSTESAYGNFVTSFLTLPKSHGTTLHALAFTLVVDVMQAVLAVVKSIAHAGRNGREDRLALTGMVWATCKAVSDTSSDNAAAVLRLIKDEEGLLLDAVAEMEQGEMTSEYQKLLSYQEQLATHAGQAAGQPDVPPAADPSAEYEEEPTMWTHEERLLIAPCMGLVRTARYCIKKIKDVVSHVGPEACATPTWVAEFDSLAGKVKALSPAVDDFVLSVYPPSDRLETQANVLALISVMKSLIMLVRESHYVTEEDLESLEYLMKAVDHNSKKMQTVLAPEA